MCDVGGCALVRVSAAHRHSWLGCCGACVLVCALRLHPATPGWGVRCGCVCLGSGFGCAPQLLAGVSGCVCACVPVLLVPCHSWLGCAAWVCVLGLGFWLRPATPGWGVGVCVCWCSRSACTPPLLARVCGVGVCVWARVSAAPRHSVLGCWGVRVGVCGPPVPRHSWLGRAAWVCVFGFGFQLRPTTPGWAVGLCVCWCGRSPCSPPLLAGVCGVGVCVWVRVPAAPRHSWLGCWGVCVLVWALPLYPATPGWGVRRGCVCFGSGFGCAPPLLAGMWGCACWCACSPCTRHSWLGCAAWVCVLWFGFRLRPATPGWGVRVRVCWCGRSLCTPPLLAGVCGVGVCVWARISAAPRHSWLGCWGVCVLVCLFRLYPATPGWGVRRGCVCFGSCFGCAPTLLARVLRCVCAGVRAPLVPRHSWLGGVLWVCVLGLRFRSAPPLLAGVCGMWVGCCLAPVPVPWFVVCCARCRGLRHPVAVVAWHLSWCWGCGRRCAPLTCLVAPRWCAAPRPVRSLSVLRSAFPSPSCLPPTWGLAPPALLGGCAGHAEAGREPGSFCVRLAPAKAGALGSLRVVPVRGPAMGLSLAGPSGVGPGLLALRWLACVDPVTDASGFPYRPSFDGGLGRCTGAVSCGRRHLPLRVRGRHARPPCKCACARPSWLGRAGRPPGRFLVRLTFSFGRLVFLLCWAPSGLGLPLLWFFDFPPPFFFLFFLHALRFLRPPCLFLSLVSGPWCLGPWRLVSPLPSLPPPGFFFSRPRCLWLSLVSGPGCPGPWRCVLFVLLASRSPPLRALSPLLWFLPGRWLFLGGCCPRPPPFVSRCFSRCRFVLCFFFPFRAPVVSGFLWFPAPGALGLGAVCCLFCWPPAPRLSARSHLFCGSCLAGGCSSVVAPPPPPPPPPFCAFLFFSPPLCAPFFCFFLALRAPVVSGFPWFPPPGALGLGAVCCLFCWASAPGLSVCSRLFCGDGGCSLVVPAPPPLPLVSRWFCCFLFVLRVFFSRFATPCCPWLSLVSGPGCLGPWRCVLFVLLASRSSARRALSPLLWFLPGPWLLLGGCCPPPLLCLAVFLAAALCSVFFSVSRPRCLWLSLVCGPGWPGPWRCGFVLSASCPSAPRALSPLLCFPPGCWLLRGVCCPPPPLCLAVFVAAPPPPLVRAWCLVLSGVATVRCPSVLRAVLLCLALLCCGLLRAVRCSLGCLFLCCAALLVAAACCAVSLVVLSGWVVGGVACCLVLVCVAVCRAVLCVPGCVAAPRCCVSCLPVLCCCVLCGFVALVQCRCLLCRVLWRCPSPWGPVLCCAVFCGVPPHCVLCAVCVLSWRAGARCCSPLCCVLCVSWGVALCVRYPPRSVRCCVPLCSCACVVLFVWCVLLLAPGAAVRCCVLRCFIWCSVVRCSVRRPVVVCWLCVSASVSLSGRVV